MDSFYERTKNGEKLRLNYINNYYEDGVEKTYTFYIKYDGDYYITNYQMYTNSPKETKYKYLVYSTEDGKEGSNIEKIEYYCLANQEFHTYQVVHRSWLSAILEHHILDANPFYRYEQYKDGFKLGSYSSKKSLDLQGVTPAISFFNSYQYSIVYSSFSSFIDFGEYEINDGYVYLISNQITNYLDEKVKLAFKLKSNKLIFDLKKSNVDDYKFDDGTVFNYDNEY